MPHQHNYGNPRPKALDATIQERVAHTQNCLVQIVDMIFENFLGRNTFCLCCLDPHGVTSCIDCFNSFNSLACSAWLPSLLKATGFSVSPTDPPDPFTSSLFCSWPWSVDMQEKSVTNLGTTPKILPITHDALGQISYLSKWIGIHLEWLVRSKAKNQGTKAFKGYKQIEMIAAMWMNKLMSVLFQIKIPNWKLGSFLSFSLTMSQNDSSSCLLSICLQVFSEFVRAEAVLMAAASSGEVWSLVKASAIPDESTLASHRQSWCPAWTITIVVCGFPDTISMWRPPTITAGSGSVDAWNAAQDIKLFFLSFYW